MNIASASAPPRYGHAVNSHRLSRGTDTSQSKTEAPKKNAVYFESSMKPPANPAAIHHGPCPVLAILASTNSRNAAAAIAGASGVATRDSIPTIGITLKKRVANAAESLFLRRMTAARHTAKLP